MFALKIFSSVCGLALLLINSVFWREEIFNSDEVQFKFITFFSSTDSDFAVVAKKAVRWQSHRDFSLVFSSRSYIVLGFTFRSMIHFKLIFSYDEIIWVKVHLLVIDT